MSIGAAAQRVYWGVAAACFAAALAMVAWYVPADAAQGQVQKIFYLHFPVAISALAACAVVFVAGLGYLTSRDPRWDDLGAAAAKVSVLLCSVVLLTGMIWARSAWGAWWTWSPRLTFSLMLWLLYVVLLVVRASIDSDSRRRTVAAVYGVAAFIDVPLVYVSARLLPDIHPASISLAAAAMKITLATFFAATALLTAGLIGAGCGVERARRLRAAARGADAQPPRPDLARVAR